MTRALIVAGGRGSRLAAACPDLPKPLVPVGGRALLLRLIDQLDAAGFERIDVALGHRAEEVGAELEGLAQVHPLIEAEPRGTCGSVAELGTFDGPLVVLNGDLFTGLDFAELLTRHATRSAHLTVATHVEQHQIVLGEVECDSEGRLRRYVEKPLHSWRISSGIYAMSPEVRALLPARGACSIPELVNRAVQEGLAVFEWDHGAPWVDVNDAEDLERAERMLAENPEDFAVESLP